jgi:hypothetical protein
VWQAVAGGLAILRHFVDTRQIILLWKMKLVLLFLRDVTSHLLKVQGLKEVEEKLLLLFVFKYPKV